MKQLYLDNFRGFKNTYIPLKDVNFFVGENSTGKTSVVKLLDTLFNVSNYVLDGVSDLFNNSYVKFGKFKDIVSVVSKNKSCFKVGSLYFHSKNQSGKQKTFLRLMVFKKSKDGMSTLYQIYNFYNGLEWGIQICGKHSEYYFKERDDLTEKSGLLLFKRWVSGRIVFKKKCKGGIYSVLSRIPRNINKKGARTGSSSYQNVLSFKPIRTEPKRFYYTGDHQFSPSGNHTPFIVKNNRNNGKLLGFIEKFGKESGLFKEVKSRSFKKSLDSPFELNVYLENKPISIINVGYGVSQSLPIIVDIICSPSNFWFMLQQPEVHLHPRAQAAFGELIYNFAGAEKKRFFIETHSDYLIDRFRISAKKSKSTVKAQVLFFNRVKGINKIYPMDISNGQYPIKQPVAFRKFFIKENFKLLETR